jgi:hypothetical protein
MARASLAAVAVVGTLVLAGAPSASAQGGAGLYVPFPRLERTDRARAFFGDLVPTSVSAATFGRGVVLPAGRSLEAAAPLAAPASDRAGSGGDPDGGAGWLAGAALVAIAAVALAAALLRRRPPVPR